MCIRTTLRFAALLAFAAAFPALASATTILSDDFNDNSLDATKWKTYTSVTATSKVVEENGRLAITDRGYLVTKNTYDPDDYAGGITITGQWTPSLANDQLLVDTRSSDTYVNGGLIRDGLLFLGYNSGTMQIRAYSGGSRSDAVYLNTAASTGALSISAGTTYNFTIVDNGATSLSFTMTQADNAANTRTVTSSLIAGKDPATSTGNYISFANYEAPTHTCNYDNIVIKSAAIPEPSTIVLVVTGLIGLLVYAWRKRR